MKGWGNGRESVAVPSVRNVRQDCVTLGCKEVLARTDRRRLYSCAIVASGCHDDGLFVNMCTDMSIDMRRDMHGDAHKDMRTDT